jgi:hypothetical protein
VISNPAAKIGLRRPYYVLLEAVPPDGSSPADSDRD